LIAQHRYFQSDRPPWSGFQSAEFELRDPQSRQKGSNLFGQIALLTRQLYPVGRVSRLAKA